MTEVWGWCQLPHSFIYILETLDLPTCFQLLCPNVNIFASSVSLFYYSEVVTAVIPASIHQSMLIVFVCDTLISMHQPALVVSVCGTRALVSSGGLCLQHPYTSQLWWSMSVTPIHQSAVVVSVCDTHMPARCGGLCLWNPYTSQLRWYFLSIW